VTVRSVLGIPLALALLVTFASPCAAGEEEVRPRPYLGFRLGAQWGIDHSFAQGVEATTLQDIYGLTLGVDLTRHLGVELLADWFQPTLRRHHARNIGEYGVVTLMPQVRVRFPLFDDRLVPYVVAGIGASSTEFNDRKPPATGTSVQARDWGLTAAVGVGAEWFVVTNIAVGAEVRYVRFAGHDIKLDGRTRDAEFDSIVTTVTARLYFDAPPRPPGAEESTFAGPFYIGGRVGGALTLHRRNIRPGVDAPTSISGVAGFDQLFGIDLGVDLGPHVGIEVSAEGWDPDLSSAGVGRFAEYGIYSILPQLRLRAPMLDGRLVPFVLGGVGFGFAESKDSKPPAQQLVVQAKDYSWEAGVGVGVDYFVTRNITVGVQGKYVYNRDHFFRFNGRGSKVNLDALLLSFGLKVYLPSRSRASSR
jgi:opacity protein-like surface antigen